MKHGPVLFCAFINSSTSVSLLQYPWATVPYLLCRLLSTLLGRQDIENLLLPLSVSEAVVNQQFFVNNKVEQMSTVQSPPYSEQDWAGGEQLPVVFCDPNLDGILFCSLITPLRHLHSFVTTTRVPWRLVLARLCRGYLRQPMFCLSSHQIFGSWRYSWQRRASRLHS